MEKILLDTDIGSDIDDAVCLAYLLSQPKCELMGITTVSGEAYERARLASVLCMEAGEKIPIFPGVEDPLLVKQRQPHAPQKSALEKWPNESNFPQNEAINFLSKIIRQHPGEITLLGIGPMTNIALLFSIDPLIPNLLKGLVMMAGVFVKEDSNFGPLEWNSICDPHAIAKVYQSKVKIHRSVGLDVTTQVKMDSKKVREKFQSGILRPVLDFAEVWFTKQDEITFHDPLAATTIFESSICDFQKGKVEVELTNKKFIGKTHWNLSGGSHDVALSVDKTRFFDHFFSVVNNAK